MLAPSETISADIFVLCGDLWKDCGDFELTGIAPTALGGTVLFDAMELHATAPEAEY